jgi:hypothetical protein
LPQAKVDKLLLSAVEWLFGTGDRPFNERGRFTRPTLRDFFTAGRSKVTEHQANGLVDQLIRIDGVRDVSDEEQLDGTEKAYQLPPNAHLLVKHRRWRLPSGRFNLADAFQLLDMLEDPPEGFGELTAGLEELKLRLHNGLTHLRVRR